MAIMSYDYLGTPSESVSPSPAPPRPMLRSPFHSHTNFPVIPVSVIGIIATAFLLLGYYVLVIKCCLHWHRIDVLGRFSLSQRRGNNEDLPLETHSAVVENRGLDEDAIKSIPIVLHKESGKSGSDCECAVCLNEFQENDKLRVIPICNHAFHIYCIDAWLQNNANCPLCRTSISCSTKFQSNLMDDAPAESSSLEAGACEDDVSGGDEDFVVIELGCSVPVEDQRQRINSGETSAACCLVSPPPRDLEEKVVLERGKKFDKVTSMDDECIDPRRRDDEFAIEPISRSFSMDSLTDRKRFFSAQKILKQNRHESTVEGCSSRFRRSIFCFGQGRINRSSIQPIRHES